MKKFIAVILVVISVLSVFPLTVSAIETDVNYASDSTSAEYIGEGELVDLTGETFESIEYTTPTLPQTTEPSESTTEQKATEYTGEATESTGNTEASHSTEASFVTESTEPQESSTAYTEPTSAMPTEGPTNAPTEPTTQAPTKPVKPTKVQDFKVTSKSSTYVKLGWKKYSGNASRFYIYRADETSNDKFTDFKLIKTIYDEKKTSYTDKTVDSGKMYVYRIVPCKHSSKNPLNGPGAKYKVFTPMEKSKEIKVTNTTANKISLKWTKIPNATKYEVYRKPQGGSYKRIATTKELKYTDKNITSGVAYTYAVRGCRVANGKIRYSSYSFVATAAGVTAVKGVKVKSYARKGLFSWDKVSGADGYTIYKQKKNGKYESLGSTTSTNFLTERLTAGKNYKFQIKAYKVVNSKKVYGKTKNFSLNIVGTAYGKNPGNNYIEICTETQQMCMYINGKLYVKTPVVTGYKNLYDTTPGFHYVINKSRNARLRGEAGGSSWDVVVSYWIKFTWDGQGIHDSTWRYSGYGGNVYTYDGSHGCINTPINEVSKIYAKAYSGMPVIVF